MLNSPLAYTWSSNNSKLIYWFIIVHHVSSFSDVLTVLYVVEPTLLYIVKTWFARCSVGTYISQYLLSSLLSILAILSWHTVNQYCLQVAICDHANIFTRLCYFVTVLYKCYPFILIPFQKMCFKTSDCQI